MYHENVFQLDRVGSLVSETKHHQIIYKKVLPEVGTNLTEPDKACFIGIAKNTRIAKNCLASLDKEIGTSQGYQETLVGLYKAIRALQLQHSLL